MGVIEFSEEQIVREHEALDEQLNPDAVADRIAREYGVTVEDLKGRRRHAEISTARVALYAALRATGMSFPQIGYFVGHRDHSTVIQGLGEKKRSKRSPDGGRP